MEIHKKVKYALLLVALIIGISGLSLADSEDGNITYTAKYKDAISYDVTISGLGAPEENYRYYALICQEKDVTTSDFVTTFSKKFSIEYDETTKEWHGNTSTALEGVHIYDVFERTGQYYGYIARKESGSSFKYEILDGPTEVATPELPPIGERISYNFLTNSTDYRIAVNALNTMLHKGVQRTMNFYIGEVTDEQLLQNLKDNGRSAYDELLEYAKQNKANLQAGSFQDTKTGIVDYDILKDFEIEPGKYYLMWSVLDDEDGTYVEVEDIEIYNATRLSDGRVTFTDFEYTPPQQENTNNVANSNQINQNTTNNDPTVANKQIPKAGFSVLGIIAIIIAIGAVVVFYIKNKEYKQVK